MPRAKRYGFQPGKHIYNGWPHYSSGYPFHCICLDRCCQNDDTGCICPTCPCKRGLLHAPLLEREIAGIMAALERERQFNANQQRTR